MSGDLEKLQGTWNIVTLEVEGATMSQAGSGSQIVVRGDAFTTSSMGDTYNGTLTLDDSRTPKTLDMMFTEGPHAGKMSLAIYELDGDDWKICLCFAGGIRPKEFTTAVGSGHALETLKRQIVEESKVEQSSAVADPSKADHPELALFQGDWIMVSGIQGGTSFPADFVASGRRVVAGNETTVSFGGQVFLNAALTLDASVNPKSIDYTVLAGPQTGKVIYGIYEFAEGSNRLCFSALGAARPTEFVSNSGDGRTLTVWTKAAK